MNNAGVGMACPMETVTLEEVRRHFDVNLVGQIAVTQAMLPLIRRGGGRLIFLGSIGDRLTIPFGGLLCGSKSAVAAVSSAWRQELAGSGIQVCVIEPAAIATEAVDKLESEAEERLSKMAPEMKERYGAAFRRFAEVAVEEERQGSPPSVVGETILRALTDRRPRTRYLCGKGARLMALAAWLLPEQQQDRLLHARFGV